MTTDREKVIAALEWCIEKPCNPKCPYFTQEDKAQAYCLFKKILPDALALLKGQEARVVTTADFENNPNLDDGGHLNVWEEYKDGTRYRWNTINVNDVRAFTDIHRYWTSRPTPEQMRDTPWEGEGIK